MNQAQMFVELSLVMFLATAFRTAFGFGEALIAVPLLSLILPIKVSAPVAVLASIVIATFAVIRDWKHIHFSSARRLLVATALGVPVGLFVLSRASESVVKAVLGLALAAFAAFSLHKPRSFNLKDDKLIWPFGFLAGVTGGAYGMNGPPLVIYGTARGWSAKQFRATLQAYFLPASILGMVGYYFSGVWTSYVSTLFADSLPAITLGIFAGRYLGRKLENDRFTRFLHLALIFVAVMLLFQACRGTP